MCRRISCLNTEITHQKHHEDTHMTRENWSTKTKERPEFERTHQKNEGYTQNTRSARDTKLKPSIRLKQEIQREEKKWYL